MRCFRRVVHPAWPSGSRRNHGGDPQASMRVQVQQILNPAWHTPGAYFFRILTGAKQECFWRQKYGNRDQRAFALKRCKHYALPVVAHWSNLNKPLIFDEIRLASLLDSTRKYTNAAATRRLTIWSSCVEKELTSRSADLKLVNNVRF